MVPIRNYPRYVQRDINNLVNATPALAEDITLYIFLVASDPERQQKICDQFLNDPADRAYERRGLSRVRSYKALFPQVFVFFARYGALRSLAPTERDHGYVQYCESGIWILTDVQREPFPLVNSYSAVFPYYMFVDQQAPITVGRELQGWNKEFADIQVPSDPGSADPFSLKVPVVPTFGLNATPTAQELIHLTPLTGPGDGGREAAFLTEAGVFLDARSKAWWLGLPSWTLRFLCRGITFAFLKQFRDVKNPLGNACYQAGVETEFVLKRIRALPRKREYRLDIQKYASHPLVEHLGLDESSFSNVTGWCFNFDFVLQNGVELWRVP